MLMKLFIIQVCLNVSGTYNSACKHAVEASAMQSHIQQDVIIYEKRTLNLLQKEVSSVTGKQFIATVGTLAKMYKDKSIQYKVIRSPKGLMPSLEARAQIGGGAVNLGWRW